jgi:3-carboxy-cis,cis-muconate cycloisomerase
MSTRLIDSLVTTPALAAAFDDEAYVGAMVAFECALARAQARVGVIPAAAAEAIVRAAEEASFDVRELARESRAHATVALPFVQALTTRVEAVDRTAAAYVHRGATSQDVIDTALVLCVRRAWTSIAADHRRIVDALRRLSDAHAQTVMLGRTLLQPAAPTTFGLKVAGWLGGIARAWRGWLTSYRSLLVVQCGGAAGTLAAVGPRALDVERAVADELGLGVPDAPWHAHRDRVAAFAAAAGIYAGTLAKAARDIALLMQPEIGEAAERGGGSSAMPQKRNPSGSTIVLAAAQRLPGLVSSVLAGMAVEHERSIGGWQAEASAVADAVQAAGAAAAALADVLESLVVDASRMRRNLDATRGQVLAEQLLVMLAPHLGRARATELVKDAVVESQRSSRSFAEVIESMPEAMAHLTAQDVAVLAAPERHLGAAEAFRTRLIDRAFAAEE